MHRRFAAAGVGAVAEASGVGAPECIEAVEGLVLSAARVAAARSGDRWAVA
jgi:hypothetical protein